MEKKIKELLEKKGLTRVKLLSLIDLGNALDADLEEYPIVADIVEIRDGDVYIYDEADEDENGVVEPIFKVSELKEFMPNTTNDLFWVLNETLEIKG